MKLRLVRMLLVSLLVLGGAAWVGQSSAQTAVLRIGVLTVDEASKASGEGKWLEPFRRKLAEQGWSEPHNVSFEYRNAGGDPSRFREIAAEIVESDVDVIFAPSAPAVRASHAATRTIPIVGLDLTTDPVAEGYAESFGRPGGNVTGVFLDAPGFAGKWLELLKAMVAGLSRIVVLWDPSPGEAHLRALRGAASSFGIELQVVEVRKPEDIERAAAAFRGRPQALISLPSPMMYVESARLAKLALQHRLPATSMFREFTEAGGTLAYGPEMTSTAERCAMLVARVLHGVKPGALPIAQPEAYELVVNLKTAKAIGLRVPQSVLGGATAVIR
jgi:putative ABC transport system substrate-binding protein